MRRTLVVLTSAMMLALALVPAAAPAASRCDPLDKRGCLLPWPSNAYTVLDARTDTGRRLDLKADDMPRNAKGARVSPAEFNRADGFSPGSTILTYVPGINLKRTGATPVTDLRRSQDRGQPIALVNATTQTRELAWAEIDPAAKGKDRLLVIHPARNLARGQRYIVGLGRMRDDKGRIIKASAAFRAMRDQLQTSDPALERRRIGFERMFQTLAKVGLKRKDLFQAWDFTVASTPNATERAVDIRDNAFAVLGDNNLVDRNPKGGAPRFALDAPQEFAPCGTDGCQPGENDLLARTVTGVMTVPCYLNRTGCPVGSTFRYRKLKKTANFQADRFVFYPERKKNNTMQVPFRCVVPRAALARPSRLVVFGHAPYAGQDDVLRPDVQQLAQDGNLTFCAARQAGYASEDLGTLKAAFADVDTFPRVADRLQQGALNSILLGRLMLHPQGLVQQGAFRTPAGTPAIDTFTVYYDTISAGAFGGMVAALSPDSVRASLGTGGMNHTFMLPRSTAYTELDSIFRAAYPRRVERALLLSMLQGQWDRGETGGYAQSLTQDPLPSTPLHTLLFQAAVGDHRVPNLATEIEARTVEAVKRDPLYDKGRSADRISGFGITPSALLELGSVLTMWDGGPVRDGGRLGTPIAPTGPVPPTVGVDPHELPSQTPDARKQRSDFFNIDARFIDPCRPTLACRAVGY